ncbi:MAG: hypothetical protein IJV40_16670 [Oscillospiraceae bacterium]|nr:hypothetical protein [Oscillospiraceae bacterium]
MKKGTRRTVLVFLADFALLAVVALAFLFVWKKPLAKPDREYLRVLDAAVTETLLNSRGENILDRLDAELEQVSQFPVETLRNRKLRELDEAYRSNLLILQSLLVPDPQTGEPAYTDALAWYESLADRGRLLQTLCSDYALLVQHPDLTDDIAKETLRQEALAQVESDLREQLLGASPQRLRKNGVPYLEYRNKTDYTVDLSFVNLYQASDGRRLCDIQAAVLAPKEHLKIQLENMPDDCGAWVTDWEIEDIIADQGSLL